MPKNFLFFSPFVYHRVCYTHTCYKISTYMYIFLPFLLLMAFVVRVIWFLDSSSYKFHTFFFHSQTLCTCTFPSDFIYFAFNGYRMFTSNELKKWCGGERKQRGWVGGSERVKAQRMSMYIRLNAVNSRRTYHGGALRMEKPNWEMEEFKTQNSLRRKRKEKKRKITKTNNSTEIANH